MDRESKKDLTKIGDSIYFSSDIPVEANTQKEEDNVYVSDSTPTSSQPKQPSQPTSLRDNLINKVKKSLTKENIRKALNKVKSAGKKLSKEIPALVSNKPLQPVKSLKSKNKLTLVDIGVGRPLAKQQLKNNPLKSDNNFDFQPSSTMGLTNISDAINSLSETDNDVNNFDISPTISLSQLILSGQGLKSEEDNQEEKPQPSMLPTYTTPNQNMIQAVESVGQSEPIQPEILPPTNYSQSEEIIPNNTPLEDRFIEWYQKKELKKQKMEFIKHEVIGLKKHQFFDNSKGKKKTLLETDYFKSIKKRRIL